MGTASTGRVPSSVDCSYLHPWQLLPLSMSSDRMVGCEMVSVKSVNGGGLELRERPSTLSLYSQSAPGASSELALQG